MKELNTQNFNEETNADVPVVVDFWAPWCGPCRSQTPILEQFAQKYDGKVKVCKVNTDQNSDLAMRFGIMSIPTLIVFEKGEPAHKAVGLHSLTDLKNLIGL